MGLLHRAVGAFACHDCAYLFMTTKLPRKTVVRIIDLHAADHDGHRFAWSVRDV